MTNQPNLFKHTAEGVVLTDVILYALGDFQSRGKVLSERELPLERLLGAFRRAAEYFEIEMLTDERLAESLRKLGAQVVEVPDFVAKHPYRVTIPRDLARRAEGFHKEKTEAAG